MSAPPFLPPVLIGVFIVLALFAIILLIRRRQQKEVRAFSYGSTLVLLIFLWLILFGSLGSLTALGALACKTGFYANLPAPLSSSVLITSSPKFSGPGLVTLNARDGSTQKQQSFPQSISGSATAISNNTVYFMNNTNLLSAYRLSDGSFLWSTALITPGGKNEQNFRAYGVSLIFADGLLYASMSDPNNANNPGRMYALRTDNGSIAWTLVLPPVADLDHRVYAAGSGLLVLATGKEGISAYHASDGSPTWKLPGKAFSTDSNAAHSFTLSFINSTLYFAQDVGLVNSGSVLMAIHPSNGQVLWQRNYEGDFGSASDVSFSGTHLYLQSSGILYTLNATHGNLLWQHDLGQELASGAAVEVNGVVYVPGDIFLYALNAQDGSQIWKQKGNDLSAFGTPVVLQNVVLVSSSQAITHGIEFNVCPGFASEPREAIFALNAQNGSIYWRSPNTAGPMVLSNTL